MVKYTIDHATRARERMKGPDMKAGKDGKLGKTGKDEKTGKGAKAVKDRKEGPIVTDAMGGLTQRRLRFTGALLSFVTVALIILSTTMSWGTLDVTTKIGPIPVTLKADIYEYGINYEANLSTAGGLLGGIGGGMVPSKIAANKVFVYGLGEFQETIGFVKGTSKEKTISTTSYTWPPPENGTSESRITVGVKSIPWWPSGLEQDLNITIEVTSATNMSEIKVVKVWFELHRMIEGQDKYKVVWEKTPGDTLTKVGDRKTYAAKAQAEEDYGEFWIVGKAWLEMKDSFGHSNKISEGSYRELTSPPKEVKLWTISSDKSVRIAALVAAFPLTIMSGCFLITAAIFALMGWRREWQLCLMGAILAILAVVSYASGVYALMDLTGYSSWFHWSAMFPLAIGASLMSIAPALLMFIGRKKKPAKAVGTVKGGAPAPKVSRNAKTGRPADAKKPAKKAQPTAGFDRKPAGMFKPATGTEKKPMDAKKPVMNKEGVDMKSKTLIEKNGDDE